MPRLKNKELSGENAKMGKNSFGQFFRLTTFGESHGEALGAVIDGCPAGVIFDHELLTKDLKRRRPGFHEKEKQEIVSARNEEDLPEILSGIYQNKTLGTPIAVIIRNIDQRSEDYDYIKLHPRKGHADEVWQQKFNHVDYRGGGRSSGRETVSRVIGGAVAQMYLRKIYPHMKVYAYAAQIGNYTISDHTLVNPQNIDQFFARFPDPNKQKNITKLLTEAKHNGNTYGGKASLIIENPPVGLGQPVFHKLKADLAAAIMGIGATCAVEIGEGMCISQKEGSELYSKSDVDVGGILGGISTGDSIKVNVYFKPPASVLDIAKKGRHDPCMVPRVIPVLEAMANLVLADHCLWMLGDKL